MAHREADRGTLDVVVEQTAPLRLETSANGTTIEAAAQRAAAEAAELVVFPELALTGYDLGRWASDLAVDLDGPPPCVLPDGPVVVLGLPERAADGRVFNSAAAWRGDRLLHRHRKRYLPTYGMFDEGRVFAPGETGPHVFPLAPGWSAALLICEELWHPACPYLAGLGGADLLIVLAAAAGRGPEVRDGEAGFRSNDAWTLLARSAALTYGAYVILANRAGVEGGLTFSGQSLIVGPDGGLVRRAGADRADRLTARIDAEEVRSARTRFCHRRDDDPRLLATGIEALLSRPTAPDDESRP